MADFTETGERACNHHSDCAAVERKHPGVGHCYDPECEAPSAEHCKNVALGGGGAGMSADVHELQRELNEAAEDATYWYRVSQALVLRVALQHFCFDDVERLVYSVQSDAATGFRMLNERQLGKVVQHELFEGLRGLLVELQKHRAEEAGHVV
jgi:hypothetical protein